MHDAAAKILALKPPYKRQKADERTIGCACAFAPVQNALVVACAPVGQPGPAEAKQRQLVYQCEHSSQSVEHRDLFLQSYTVFSSLQKIAQDMHTSSNNFGLSANAVQPDFIVYSARICTLLKDAVLKQLPANSSLSASSKAHSLAHHATMHAILALAQLLYMPYDGQGEGLVGEEFLDWVNTVDRGKPPTSAEGEELADLATPWDHPNFWPYVYRCILRAHILSATALLQVMTTHPSPTIQTATNMAVELLKSLPRSTEYRQESQFLRKSTTWRASAASTLKKFNSLFTRADSDSVLGGPDNEDERLDWEAGLRCLFELLAGIESRILEASEDWREALAAWTVWVNPGVRRSDLPTLLNIVLKSHPIDSSLPSEVAQTALVLGDVARALQQSNLVSPWLVAHLSDLLDKLALVDGDDSYDTSLRDYFVLSYTDILQADWTMWRVTVDYLGTCGSEGLARMTRVLESVPLDEALTRTEAPIAEESGMDVEDSADKDERARRTSVAEDVIRVSVEYGLDEQLASICKAYAERLSEQQRFGEAIPFCVRAGDWKRIARISDRILEAYVVEGQEAFIKHVDSIPTSLLVPASARHEIDSSAEAITLETAVPFAPVSSRLSFLARYRDFFAFYARGDRRQAASLLVLLLSSNVVPKKFVPVMLLDAIPLLQESEPIVTMDETYELLRCLEEITMPITSTGVDVYHHLDNVARLLGAPVDESRQDRTTRAMKQLDVLRFALARNLARCCGL
ncbi:hypothetical protein OIV83_003555 [Microbotryomycetes sp. JL201]|nr:hypothetical protein OIV83_003555 [Microbotryomycetes sp. JL201]